MAAMSLTTAPGGVTLDDRKLDLFAARVDARERGVFLLPLHRTDDPGQARCRLSTSAVPQRTCAASTFLLCSSGAFSYS